MTDHCRPSDAELLAYLKSNDIFCTFSDSVLQNLVRDLDWVCLRQGETLFRQGDPGGSLYFVFNGCLQVSITQKDGSELVVAEVGPGKLLGEIQFLFGGTRTASISALQKTDLLKLSKEVFDRFTDQSTAIFRQIADIIHQRLQRDQLAAMLPNLCGSVDTAMLKTIEAETEWFYLPQGEALFHQGDPGESFFLLISGRLQAVVRDDMGHEWVVGEVRRGEIVGEMAIFTGEDRTASVYAIRNSELVKFSRQAFEQLIELYPKVMLHMARTIIKRSQPAQTLTPTAKTVLNFAIVPAGPETPLRDFANRLAGALSIFGKTLHLNSERLDTLLEIPGVAQTPEDAPNNIRIAAWLDEQETQYKVIIYEADMFTTPWTKRCIQQADRILVVAQATANPIPGKIERALLSPGKSITQARRILVLLHPDGSKLPSETQEWLDARPVESHYHLRWDTKADFDRLARFVSGNAVGLVLGGGGARGLAHIGVIRALIEARVPIDMIGGTSIGGAIAAQYAMGMDYKDMLEINRKIWIEWKSFNDYTLPIMSILKGRKFEHAAEKVYGDILIEDLWINFFCVSTNLTTTDLVIHQKGRLTRALRATASLPGIALPLVDNHNLLVDGGVLNSLPGDIMRNLCDGYVIAVSVSPEKDLTMNSEKFPSPWKVVWGKLFPFSKPIHVPNIVDLLMRTTMVSSVQRTNAVKMDADLCLQPPVNHFKLLEFKALDEIAEVGYQYTKEQLEELKKRGEQLPPKISGSLKSYTQQSPLPYLP
jgi:predicted acylesterase/phospholipase RssA/CRP-like cAMP-binding protein